jgi:hypothetical protein
MGQHKGDIMSTTTSTASFREEESCRVVEGRGRVCEGEILVVETVLIVWRGEEQSSGG